MSTLGYKHTQESKEKIRQSRLGRKRPTFSDEWKKNIGDAHRGLESSLKGKPRPQWVKDKIKATQRARYLAGELHIPSTKGRKATEEERRKRSEALKGERAPGWKGGVYPENKRIRGSLEYRLWRTAVFERDDYTCQFCRERGGELNADHIKEFAYFPELRLELSNGRTLCVPCHRKTDSFKRRYN